MRKLIASILVAALAVALVLSAVIALVAVSIRVSLIVSPAVRAVAVVAEMLLGVFWLLGIVYVATHLGVRIFRRSPPPRA
jgi:hypothetical protein